MPGLRERRAGRVWCPWMRSGMSAALWNSRFWQSPAPGQYSHLPERSARSQRPASSSGHPAPPVRAVHPLPESFRAEEISGEELLAHFQAVLEQFAGLLRTAVHRCCYSCLREARAVHPLPESFRHTCDLKDRELWHSAERESKSPLLQSPQNRHQYFLRDSSPCQYRRPPSCFRFQ